MYSGMKFPLVTLLLSISCITNAAYKDTSNVKVHLISVWSSSGDVLVQINPQHNIDGLECESAYWLKLNKDAAGHDSTLSLLLSAQVTQKPVTVRAYDDAGSDFCRLDRVITTP